VSEAGKILAIADRTARERRNMAEFYAVGYEWNDDLVVARFADGSSLMMTLDSDLCPTEIIEVNS
jgi:hypothetical protein